MKTIILISLLFGLVTVCNGQEKGKVIINIQDHLCSEKEIDNSDEEIDNIKKGEEKVILKDGQCTYCFDEKLDKNIYIETETIAEFEPRDSEFVTIIRQKTNISEDEFLSTFNICGSHITFAIVIDEHGAIILYTPILTNNSFKTRNQITPVDESIKEILKDIKKWIPATCNGKAVASTRHFRLSTRWFQPKEKQDEYK